MREVVIGAGAVEAALPAGVESPRSDFAALSADSRRVAQPLLASWLVPEVLTP
jgi:hypothetical protein